jgi:general secretion pathway protein D
VLIEARLIETSMNPTTTKGVDWSGTLAAQHVTVGNNAAGGVVGSPGIIASLSSGSFFSPATAFMNADGVQAVLSFMNTFAESKIISCPRTVTLDNETAHINVSTARPIINVTPGTANTTGGSSIVYTNLGISLDVTPRISANDFVNLKVIPEVARVADTITRVVGTAGKFEVDEYDSRRIETHVMIPSGNTLVLGGLIQDDIRKGNNKVPLLGDIPYLGMLFRSDTKKRQQSNLTIFITPTIVKDSDYQPTKTDYLQTPVPTSDYLEGDWSAWDSGKPKDFKKKQKEDAAYN